MFIKICDNFPYIQLPRRQQHNNAVTQIFFVKNYYFLVNFHILKP